MTKWTLLKEIQIKLLAKLKVPMKQIFFLHIFKTYTQRFKHTIPKFEMCRIKIGDFISVLKLVILVLKMVKGLGRVVT